MDESSSISPRHFSPREENLFYRVWHMQQKLHTDKVDYPNFIGKDWNYSHDKFSEVEVAGHDPHLFKNWERMFADYVNSLIKHVVETHDINHCTTRLTSVDSTLPERSLLEKDTAAHGSTVFSNVKWDDQTKVEDHSAKSSFPLSILEVLRSDWDVSSKVLDLSPTIVEDDEMADQAYRRLMRMAFTGFHNTSGANESPFLGDFPSVHNLGSSAIRAPTDTTWTLPHSRSDSTVMVSSNESRPVLSHLPTKILADCHMSVNSDSILPDEIPPDAWMLPYVIARLSKDIVQLLVQSSGKCVESSAGVRAAQSLDELARMHIGAVPTLSKAASAPEKIPFRVGSENDFFLASLSSSSDGSPGKGPNPHFPISQLHQDLPSSWHDLDHLFLSSDPSWSPWVKRRLLLIDNCLLELSDDMDTIIGYAQLNKAEISGTALRTKSSQTPPVSPRTRMQPHVLAVRVSYLKFSRIDSERERFWIRCDSFEDTLRLEKVLKMATDLTMSDVYKWDDSDESLLSKGRFTEVRVAHRVSSRNSLIDSSLETNPMLNSLASLQLAASPTANSSNILDDRFLSKSSNNSTVSHKAGRSTRPKSFSKNYSLPSTIDPNLQFDNLGLKKVSGSGQDIALKMVSKNVFRQRVENRQERSDSLVREVLAHIMASRVSYLLDISSRHSPIVQIYGVFETINDFSIELELMDAEDLFDKLSHRGSFNEAETRHIIAQLVEALRLCRIANVAHRDVKMSNVCVSRNSFKGGKFDMHNGLVKLADFGMAGFCGVDGLVRGRCGTIGYVAPEIFLTGVHEGYANNVDIFSLGVVAYTILCGYEPFFGRDEAELKVANREVQYDFSSKEWKHVSLDAKDWIRRALNSNPQTRFTPQEAREHPWLASVHSRAEWMPTVSDESLASISSSHRNACIMS